MLYQLTQVHGARDNDEGATELFQLTNLEPPPRKEDSLFRKYLLGKYGGVPRVTPGMISREAEEAAG